MELPPYRLPTWKTTLTHMWDKCAQYLKKMGGMILIASVVVWFLSYYPRTEESAGTEAHYENSYLGRLGKGCEPVFSPLGFNWKASVALLSGLPAKEIVVSTLGVLYSEGAATTPAGTEIIGGADGRPKSSSRNLSRKSSPNPPGRRKRPHCRSDCWRAAISRPPRRWHSSSSSCSTSPASPRWWPSEPKPGGNGPRHRSFTTRRCVVHGVDCLPYRFDILSNGLAGLYRMGHRDRCGGSRSSAALAARVRQAARGCASCPSAQCPHKKFNRKN